jgi:KAP family P-loop domain
VQTCEAIKLYLNVPGIIFVLACDLLILSRGFGEQRGQAVTCLDKIIQVAYRVPRPDEEQIARLIRQCSLDSGTGGLIDEAASRALAERTNRNPRRIKRIINSFILDYAGPGLGRAAARRGEPDQGRAPLSALPRFLRCLRR